MADAKHLKILAKGVAVWNKWRNKNPDVRPDLIGANLREADLYLADLSKADLSEADLSGTNLSGAKLIGANLIGANLSEADLDLADLSKADLSGAKLSKGHLSGADLGGANLRQAKLREANLNWADLTQADLRAADLRGANLSRAKLIEAYMFWADLAQAKLREADLRRANLSRAKLIEVTLEKTDLINCHLVRANLTRAELTGAKLYGTARDDWIIKDIKCSYVYWDEGGTQRSPKDRDLEPGEFERLYATLPTIEYVFENGMAPLDPLIMDRVVQAIREKKPDFDIKIDSINARGLAPSIRFTVQQEEHKEPALGEVQREYAAKLDELKGRLDEARSVIHQLIDQPKTVHITYAPNAKYLAIDGSTLNIQETSNYYAHELRKSIAENKSLSKRLKERAMKALDEAIDDIGKNAVKKAAAKIVELGKELGPAIIKTAAYAFFKNYLG